MSGLPSAEDGIGQVFPRGRLNDAADVQQYDYLLAGLMINVAYLLEQLALRVAQVEVGHLAVKELA